MSEKMSLGRDVDNHRQSTGFFDIVVGCMVWNVTVQQPFSRFTRRPNHVVTFAWPDIYSILLDACRVGYRVTVSCDNRERPTVNVHRVNKVVVGANETDEDFLPNLYVDCIR